MPSGGIRHWIPLLLRFLSGQAAVQFINLLTGILILRLLSVDEYAIYILASLVHGVGATGSDLGISQGVISIGAPLRDQKSEFASLLRAAVRIRTRFYWLTLPVLFVVAFIILRNNAQAIDVVLAVIGLTVLNVWFQQSATLATAVLNVNHDSRGLFRAGMGSAALRLILVWATCVAYPYAVAALAINVLGSIVNSRLLWAECGLYPRSPQPRDLHYSAALLRFAMPLVPGAIYYLCQSQISALLLGLAGATAAIAEVGALGRLGQLIGLLSLLNGFFVMPYFARIAERRIFVRRAIQMLLLVFIFSGLLVLSTLITPYAWLIVLGAKYGNLADEVVLAVGGASLLLAGNVVYAMVMAAKATKGQWIAIVLGIAGQIAYISAIGITGTRAALILNLIPIAVSCAFQCVVLGWVMLSRVALVNNQREK